MTNRDDMTDGAPIDDAAVAKAGRLLRGALNPEAQASDFAAGFADRTMARLAAARAAAPVTPPAVQRVAAMQRSFRLLAAAAAIAIVALGVNNTLIARTDGTSLVEAAIGLEPVSMETVIAASSEDFQ
jgi:hypothetical protein